jgi:hypothetical protein
MGMGDDLHVGSVSGASIRACERVCPGDLAQLELAERVQGLAEEPRLLAMPAQAGDQPGDGRPGLRQSGVQGLGALDQGGQALAGSFSVDPPIALVSGSVLMTVSIRALAHGAPR